MNLGQGQTIHFAANYCIKEIDQFLTRNFEKGLVADFYNKFNDAKLEINKEILGIDYDIPLNKVVWNLLSRGIPTIASIRVSDYLLNKHFPEIYTSYNPNPSDPEIKLSFDFNQLAQELDSIQELLSMPMLSEKAVSQLGIVAYKLYQLQIDLSKVAKLQLTLLILSFTGKQFNYRLHNFDTELELLAIDDVNSFIKALNNLTVKSEPKVSEFGRTKGAAILDLSIAEGEEKKANDVVLFLNQKHDNSKSSDAFYKMLTDRNIRYGKFGEVENYEEDKKQKQRFNITNKKRKESLLFLLNNIFRKTDFRAGQEAILNRALLGKDVIGLLPTGGGKSLTYQINALLQPGVCIVIDPINSLMKDQFDKLFDELKITKTRYINSFNSKKEKEYNLKLLKTGKVQILFVSPERLQMPEFRTALKECQSAKVFFSCAVIDEAHCVSEWGHDFRHVYLNLAKNLKRFAKPKDSEITLFGLTATASFDVLADVQRELDVKEDAIISLPPDAIDRKELHFKVIDTSQEYIKPGLPFYEREDQVAALKYPILRNLLQYDLPNEITQLENEGSPFEINSDSFYRKVKGKYPNAGVIFCPTKSDFLKNGVMSIMEEIEDLNYLEPTTYFGGAADNTIINKVLEKQAEQAVDNQSAYIENKKNLMVATKGFGMGIDKPNIRFTIHYAFPNSIESFYQEAGRAGRDRRESVCALLFHPIDEESNRGFFENTNKGIEREKQVINELLDEVHYEDDFFVKILRDEVKEKYPAVKNFNLYKNRYLSIYGDYEKGVRIGNIDLLRDLLFYTDSVQNIDPDTALEIADYTKELLRKKINDKNYLKFLQTSSAPGIRTLLSKSSQEKYRLVVGFNNHIVDTIVSKLKNDGNSEINARIVLASYNFSENADHLINELNKNYRKYLRSKGKAAHNVVLSGASKLYIKEHYTQIRDMADTQKAVYRLNITGVIDDYEINYAQKTLTLIFTKKDEKDYYSHFRKYLRRYLGADSTKARIQSAKKRENKEFDKNDVLSKVLFELIEFVNDEVSKKLSRSITYIKELCSDFGSLGEREFRERMVRYFTSKYARSEYLPQDTDGGTLESSDIVGKYINYIKNPPDELGGEIDNAKHLRGACDNLRIGFRQNATLDLLLSFSLFVLELRDEFNNELLESNPSLRKARELYIIGFKRLMTLPSENWEKLSALMAFFNNEVKNYNENMADELDRLHNEILLHRTNHKLGQLLTQITQ